MVKHFWGIAVVALGGCSQGYDEPPMAGSFSGEVPSSGPSPGENFAAQPDLPGAIFKAARTPSPVSGGTLLVLNGDQTAIVADPDRDQLLIVDLEKAEIAKTVTLDAGAEPGRAAEDEQGHVHLALRGSGKLLTLAPRTGEVLATRDVCAYPRGVAVSPTEHLVHVACADGSLVTLSTDAANTTPIRRLKLERDLRDVLVASDGLWVSRFRSAEILRLDAEGKLLWRTTLPSLKNELGDSVSSVAWRMVPNASGGVIVVHQRAFAGEVVPSPGGYGDTGTQGGLVSTAVTTVSEGGVATGSTVALAAPLPVDIAQSPLTGRLLLASAAIEHPQQPSLLGRTLLVSPSDLRLGAAPAADPAVVGILGESAAVARGQLVAVAFAGDTPIMQYRQPSSLVIGSRGISLPGSSVEDTGTTLFHLETGSGLACASCHPEGQEDGRVWHFSGFGPRRTQSLRGGLLGSEPFHWDGAEQNFAALTADVMQGRMSGPTLNVEQADALARYIDQLPGMPAPADESTSSAAVARGQTLFNDANVGCATCHNGARFSNDQTVFVGGNDGALQVPSLVGIWSRAPYLHDGCAQTLLARFTLCDTGQHGNLQGLSGDDLSAITAYLDTL